MSNPGIEIGVNRICVLCEISKATYYNNQEPAESFKAKYSYLKKDLEKVIEDNPSYGINRLKQALKDEYSRTIGKNTLGKLLKLWGLSLKRNIKKRKRSMLQKILILLSDKVNILIRSNIAKPFQAISSDITVIVYNGGKSKCYLAVHKDVFGQMIYCYAIMELMEVDIVMKSLKMTISYLKKVLDTEIISKIIFHQDQGSQYTSYDYIESIMSIGKLSYSSPGTPTNNPGQESFFGRFKKENRDEIYELQDFKEVKKFIEKKINYYNNKRLHTSIGYKTPYIFTKSYLKFLVKVV